MVFGLTLATPAFAVELRGITDFPSHMKTALQDHGFVQGLQRSFAKQDTVILYRLNNWRYILTVQPQNMLGLGSEVYSVGRAGAEKMHFAQIDFQTGKIRSTSMLGYLSWDAGNRELSSKICNDSSPLVCGRATYHYDGSVFELMRLEYAPLGSTEWKQTWSANPIGKPLAAEH